MRKKASLRVAVLFVILVLVWSFSLFAEELVFEGPEYYEALEEERGEIDFGGETITFVTDWNVLGFFDEDGWTVPGRLAEAEEKFNCNIELINVGGDYPEVQMTRLLAGDSDYDIWLTRQDYFMDMVTEGAFYPISEILPENYWTDYAFQESVQLAEALEFDGYLYGFNQPAFIHGNTQFMFWNKDLFEELGLTALDELYLEGGWTWDAMTEIAIEATDRDEDQWGLGHIWPIEFAMTNNAMPAQEIEGRWTFTFDQEEALTALEKIHELREVHEVVEKTVDYGHNPWHDGNIAMAHMSMWMFSQDEIEFDYGFVPLPKGPHADDHVYPVDSLRPFVLPANSADPEGMVALTNFLWRTSFHVNQFNDMSFDAQDRISYDVARNAALEWDGEVNLLEGIIGSVDPWSDNEFSLAVNAVMDGERSAAAAMDEVKLSIQELINEFFGY